MKPLVMDVVSGLTTGATIGWILGAVIRVVHKRTVHKQRVVSAVNDTFNAQAAATLSNSLYHARMVDKWGFSTLKWPICEREGDGILFTGYVKRSCMCIAPLEQSGPANSFFQQRCLSKLVKAVQTLKQAMHRRRVKQRQNVYIEELMQRVCHPSRLDQ